MVGFALLGFSAILRAQKEQIKIEAKGSAKAIAKKVKDGAAKLDKYQATLDKFGGTERIYSDDWKVIIAFILPLYKPAEKVAQCQTIPKIKAKLEELEKEKGTTWAVFMAEELRKARADVQPVEETMENSDAVAAENDLENLDEDGDPSLYGATMAA